MARRGNGRTKIEARLAHFLAAYRQGREAVTPPRPGRRPPDPERLSQVLSALGQVAGQCRASGEFIDVWSVAKLGRNEVRTAAALAWALDPRGSHGLGDSVMQALWTQVGAEEPLGVVQRVRTEVYPAADVENRVDVVIESSRALVFLEVKIDALESPNQTAGYRELAGAARVAAGKEFAKVLFLSKTRPAADDVVHVSWGDMALAIRQSLRGRDRTTMSHRLLEQFARRISRFHGRARHVHL